MKQGVINVFYALSLLLLVSCAQVVPPSGGPKDTTPPKAVSYSPDNKSTLFTGNKIIIRFNEYIQLKDMSSQLVVSPPLKYTPVVKIRKGKELEVDIKDTLLKNTTYTFNFGDAIADIDEGNRIQGFQYVFSTGSYIDSLKLSGHITDAFTGEAAKDAMVMLYTNLSDSAPYKTNPFYCGRTDGIGNYRIDNIKNGTYRVFALAQSGNGYLYHPYSEGIGFYDAPVQLKSNDSINMSLFTEIEPQLRFIKSRATGEGQIMMIFNKPPDSISLIPLNLPNAGKPAYSYIQYLANSDTAYYWINNPGLDSLRFIVKRKNKILDTAIIYSFPNEPTGKKKEKQPPLKLTLNAHDKQFDFDYHQPVALHFAAPLAKYNLKLLSLSNHKDTLALQKDTAGLPMALSLKCSLKSDSAYSLTILPGAFTDVFGHTNDTIKISFKPVEPTYFGSLVLNVKTAKKATYLVQILDGHNNVFRQDAVNGSGNIHYDALPPGNYSFRAIEDDNNDRMWTTGDYLKKRQPEKVYYLSQIINIRSNWDLTQSWNIQ